MWNPGGVMPVGMNNVPVYGQQMNYSASGGSFQPPPPPPPPADFCEPKPPLPDQPSPKVNPAPPVEPPKDEKPPLPPDPPPSGESAQELAPKDETEQIKLTVLQQQAAQWQQAQQWQQYNETVQMYQQPPAVPSIEVILEEERQFNIQYTDWKKQYNDWKEQNKNHPNQEQFNQYEQQWKTYEVQMEQKRHSILLRKEQALQQNQYPMSHIPPPPAAPTGPPPPRFMPPPVGVPPPPPVSSFSLTIPPPPNTNVQQNSSANVGKIETHHSEASSLRPPSRSESEYNRNSHQQSEYDRNSHQQSEYGDTSNKRQVFDRLPGQTFGGTSNQEQRVDDLGGSTERFSCHNTKHEAPSGKEHRFEESVEPVYGFKGVIGQKPRFEGPPAQPPRFEGPPGQRPRFEGPPGQRPRFEGPPGQRPRFEGPPGQRPRFEGPPAQPSRFEGPPGQRPRFEGPPGQRPRFEGPPTQRPRFEGPPPQRPRFDGPPGQRPRFEGPPGQRPRFERPPGQRSRFEGPPGQRFRFEGPSGQRPRFESSSTQRGNQQEFNFDDPVDHRKWCNGPPGQMPRLEVSVRPEQEYERPPRSETEFDEPEFEGPSGLEQRSEFEGPFGPGTEFDRLPEPGPEFEEPSVPETEFEEHSEPGIEFEEPPGPGLELDESSGSEFGQHPGQRSGLHGPPVHRPRFEGPPGQRPLFEGPPGQRPLFEGPPGQRPLFEGAHRMGKPMRRPFNRGQRGGFVRGQHPRPDAPVSLLDLKLDRPPTLGRSEVIKDEADVDDDDDDYGEEGDIDVEDGFLLSGDFSGNSRVRMPGRFPRGRTMPRGRGHFNSDVDLDLTEMDQEAYEYQDQPYFDEEEEVYDGPIVRGPRGFGVRGCGMPDNQFRGRGMRGRGRPPRIIGHDMPEGVLRGRFMGGRRFLPRRGMFGRGGPPFGGPMRHGEMTEQSMPEDYPEQEEVHEGYQRMEGNDCPMYHHQNTPTDDPQCDYEQPHGVKLQRPQSETNEEQFESSMSGQSKTNTHSQDRRNYQNEETDMGKHDTNAKMEAHQKNYERNEQQANEPKNRMRRNEKKTFQGKGEEEQHKDSSQWAKDDNVKNNTGSNLYVDQEHDQDNWKAGKKYSRVNDLQKEVGAKFDNQHFSKDRQFGDDFTEDTWNESNDFDRFGEKKRPLDMPGGVPLPKRREGENWTIQDQKRSELEERQTTRRVPELMSKDLSRGLSTQEEQKTPVPILSQHELDLIKQATEELKMIHGQKAQQGGSVGNRDSPSCQTPSDGSVSQLDVDPFLGRDHTLCDPEPFGDRPGSMRFNYDDSLPRCPESHGHVEQPSRFKRVDPFTDRIYDDPYGYERLRRPRSNLYDRGPVGRPCDREYMLTRDLMSRHDPFLAREHLLRQDPVLTRDPLLVREPPLTQDPLHAPDTVYDPVYLRHQAEDVNATPRVIDYGHGQTDDGDERTGQQHRRDYDHGRSPSREYDYESRYHREERDREFSRGFEADAKRDRDRYPRDKNRYDRDRYRDRDHDSHNLEMIRDRRDESLREHGQRRERPNDHSRRDRHAVDHFSKQEKRNSPTLRENVPLPPSSSSSSSSSKLRMSQSLRPSRDDKTKVETVLVDEILSDPGRSQRPDHIVVIVRGLPGAGKSYLCKLLKDKEKLAGGNAARILALDDYFMVEVEHTVKDPESGKSVVKTEMEYEYDPALEQGYKQSFIKSFKRQIDDGYFNFFIIDAVFESVEYLKEFWAYAKSKGFQVYVAEVIAEPAVCAKRNVHNRSLEDIQKIVKKWDPLLNHFIRLDVRSLLQDAAITEVEMEDTTETDSPAEKQDSQASTAEEEEPSGVTSKWEIDTSDAQLDKLDGLRHGKMSIQHARMEDYLQLPDDYDTRMSEPGKKRVRWADIEERKSQARMRDIGFVLGQTNWDKMVDDTYADRALNQTKYI